MSASPAAAASSTVAPGATGELWIPVGGMTCASCQSHVQGALDKVPGVLSAQVSLVERSARVTFDKSATAPEAFIHAVEEAGYEAELVDDAGAVEEEAAVERAAANEERSLLLRLAVALPAFGIVMWFTMPGMPGMGASAPAGSAHAGHATAHGLDPTLAIAMLVLTTVALAVSAGPFYVRAFAGLRTGTSSMSTLVALGTLSALLWSAVAILFPELLARNGVQPDLYLEAALGIVAFVLIGHNLEARARRAGRKSLRALAALVPKRARVRTESEGDQDVDASVLRKGDLLVIRPGERVAADARIVEGSSHLDESLLTGESAPRARTVGEPLAAGSVNGGGVLVARVTSVGRDSTLSRILALVRHAQSSRAATQDLADRLSARFVPAVIVLAVVTLAAWLLLTGDFTRALTSAIAVLIVACPCAMGLAVPAAVAVAVGRSAKLGVLWRDASALERAAAIDVVVLDKTGTLTFGQPRVVRSTHLGAGPAAVDESTALGLAASLEATSEHVLARAVTAEAKRRGIAMTPATDVVATAGGGIHGTVGARSVHVGSARFLRDAGVVLPAHGDATILVAVDGTAALALVIDDGIRPTSKAGIAALRARGIAVWMLSGDAEARARAVAQELGIDNVLADARPQDKLDVIARLTAEGHKVAMVGDGVNDAPALARAHVGFAMRGGTDVALEAADVSITSAGAPQVALALELAHATVRVMKQNLFWAFAYNVVAIPLAAGLFLPFFGVALSPVVASAAMAASSVSVVMNSLRLALVGKPTPTLEEHAA